MEYTLIDGVAVITLDDGKANVVSHQFLDQIGLLLDRAETEAGAVVMWGRDGMYSGGFDLGVYQQGMEPFMTLAMRGVDLFVRLFDFPLPTVAACTGHAVAAGAFLLLAPDTRIGIEGDYKICLPETAMGLAIPKMLSVMAKERLSSAHLIPAVVQSRSYPPNEAMEAGFLDEIVSTADFDDRVMEIASQLAQLPSEVYVQNRRDTRQDALATIHSEIAAFYKSGSG